MRPIVRNLAAAAIAAAVLPAAWADKDKGLPADQVMAAVQVALATQPGNVKEVEVDDERNRTVVKVEVVAPDGRKHELKVDAQTRQVVR
jgi:uncharacterized membrane protein YkoI